MNKITLVVPCYNEEEVLKPFYEEVDRISKIMDKQVFEFLFIDDGSSDSTLSILQEIHTQDNRVRYLSFSRNFGKEAAVYAGLENATGNYVAVLDADLQHPPALLPEMYQAIEEEGYECAAARRTDRNGDSKFRKFFSNLFFKMMKKISKTDMMQGATDYRLMSRKMVKAILSVGEYNRFSKGIFGWVGFSTKWIEYEDVARAAGNTKWSFWKLFSYAMDGIIAFSTAPLILASLMGILFCVISGILILVVVIKTLIWGDPVAGFPTLITVIFLVGGIMLLCIGILGQYLAKVYLEVKNRPIYLIGSTEKDNQRKKVIEVTIGETDHDAETTESL